MANKLAHYKDPEFIAFMRGWFEGEFNGDFTNRTKLSTQLRSTRGITSTPRRISSTTNVLTTLGLLNVCERQV